MPFTTQANIEQLLARSYQESATVISAARWTAILTEVDGIVMSLLPEFYTFNANGGTPACPMIVQTAAQNIGGLVAMKELILANAIDGVDAVLDRLKADGYGTLHEIRSNPDRWIPPETVSTETLVFGTTGGPDWDLDVSEAFLAVTSPLASGDPPNILDDTVRLLSTSSYGSAAYTGAQIADMRNGVEFSVRWSPEYQRNVFTAHRSDLYASGNSIKATYQWTYRRDRGIGMKAASGVLLNL